MRHFLFVSAMLLALPTQVEAADGPEVFTADLRNEFPMIGEDSAPRAEELAAGIVAAVAEALSPNKGGLPHPQRQPQPDTQSAAEGVGAPPNNTLVATLQMPKLGQRDGSDLFLSHLTKQLHRLGPGRGFDILFKGQSRTKPTIKDWVKTLAGKGDKKTPNVLPGQFVRLELSREHKDLRRKALDTQERYQSSAAKIYMSIENAPKKTTVWSRLASLKPWATSWRKRLMPKAKNP